MKTPNHLALLYDAYCPFCRWYTQLFVQWGLLAPGNRRTLQSVLEKQPNLVPDPDRARHEIPLVDLQTGFVRFGIDALIALVAYRWKWVKTVANWAPIHFLLHQLYLFVSYNRRVIAGEKVPDVACDCAPKQHLGYQSAFIVLASLLSVSMSWIFGVIAGPWLQLIFPEFHPLHILLLVGTGWVLQGVWALLLVRERLMEYLASLAVITVSGLVLLLLVAIPGLLLQIFLPYGALLIIGLAVGGSFTYMWRQHQRRLALLNLSNKWHLAWTLNLWLGLLLWTQFLFQ